MSKVMVGMVMLAVISVGGYYASKDRLVKSLSNEVDQSVRITAKAVMKEILPQPTPIIILVTPEELMNEINGLRGNLKIAALVEDKKFCTLFNQSNSAVDMNKCVDCAKIATVFAYKYRPVNELTNLIINDATVSGIIKQKEYTHICVTEENDLIKVVAIVKKPKITPFPIVNISEVQLWQALLDYRSAHRLPTINLDENLCVYARKRAAEHSTWFKENKPKDQYVNQEKYPLDAHEGFKKDAESGLVFEITGKTEIAENLAYWPNALYATHVIEWGWDTSTEGHRETQLSANYNYACVTGNKGFFVAIFGR